MKKLRTICATLTLALTFTAPAYAEDGIMGTGVGSSDPTPRRVVHAGESADGIELLLEIELVVWQKIIGLY